MATPDQFEKAAIEHRVISSAYSGGISMRDRELMLQAARDRTEFDWRC